MMAAPAGAMPIALLCLLASAARAEPSIRVRSATQIQLLADRVQNSVSCHGTLLDDLGTALPDRVVQLHVDGAVGASSGEWRAARTQADGRFGLSFPSAPMRQTVFVRFVGESLYAATEASVSVDPAKDTVALRFVASGGTPFDLDVAQHSISVRATSAAGPAGLEITLSDERHAMLGRSRTAADGIARFSVTSDHLGPPGVGLLFATSAQDDARSAARAEIGVLRFLRTHVQLNAWMDGDPAALVVSGQLRDRRGGLARKAVGLFDGPRHLATVMTDKRGMFQHSEPIGLDSEDQAKTLRLSARYTSDTAARISSSSPTVVLKLTPPVLPNALWAAGPLALCCVFIWLASRASRPAVAQSNVRAVAGVHASIAVAGEMSASIDCTARDMRTHRPVPFAHCTLQAGTGERIELLGDGRGHLRSANLGDGQWKIDIGAPGYATVSATLTIPHRGAWTGARADLESLRDASVNAYTTAALRVLDSPELWQTLTPREMLRGAMRSGRASEEFVSITDQIERTAYGKEQPTLEDLASIERGADALRLQGPS